MKAHFLLYLVLDKLEADTQISKIHSLDYTKHLLPLRKQKTTLATAYGIISMDTLRGEAALCCTGHRNWSFVFP